MEAPDVLETVREDVEDEDGEESQSRAMYRIAFEEYLGAWMKTASTNAVVLRRHDSLSELIKCPERFLEHYGIQGIAPDGLVQEKCQSSRGILSVPGKKHLKIHTQRKWARVNQMRKIYQLYKTPDPLSPQFPEQMDLVRDPEMKEGCWESEVDKLVEWTHSLSFEELDRQ